MASSSSDPAFASASFRQPKHEVFLSFRGEDTRNNFLYHLYEAFRRKGVGVYADFEELPRGEEISHALLKAIEESMISVIVFSQKYATSSWCLEELSKIMECRDSRRQLVVPIFYHVSPSDIRKQTGSFGTAFDEHDKNRMDKVQGWRHALTQAGNLSGFTLAGDRPEPHVIEDIVLDIVNKLTRLSKSDYKGFIGIGSHMEQIKSLLCIGGKDVRIIGIWGMGGIGKTTLAQVLYYEVIDKFESHYFMANVREELGKCSATSLRKRLLSKLLNDKSLHIDTPTVVPTSIRRRLRRKRVFVVLDDVNDFDQLEKLGISYDHLGSGSRIIITSRDKQVFKNGSADEIYEVKKLSYTYSLQLFCSFAFKQNHPASDFKDLSNSFLDYAKGVPLALRVLGSALHKKEMAYWKSALKRLKKELDPKIQDVLKISYDGLQESEKNIFLDIACFFKGYNRDYVTNILDGCYEYSAYCGITNLIDKCLLDVSKESMLGMHDLLQEMGRNVVLAESPYPEKRSRLWTQDDVRQVLENGGGTKIQGMLLDHAQTGEIQLDPGAFARMRHLRIIKFYGKRCKLVPLHQGLESLPNELRCFHWEYCMLKSLPSKFRPEKLVELRLPNSKVEQLWNGKQNLVNLKVLELQHCKNLTRIPDLSAATNIEALSIKGCESLVELPSMIHMKKLSFFFDGHVNSKSPGLNLHDCHNLKKFPELPQHIRSLILYNTAIEEIPDSIGNLNQLERLILSNSRIKAVPNNIYKLESLEELTLAECPILQLPEVSRNFNSSDLRGNQIEERPLSIGRLNGLARLVMKGSRIHNLPSTIVQLDALKSITLSDCPNITEFPNVPENIQWLYLDNTAIEEVPSSISRLKSLVHLRMKDCRKLKSLPTSICELTSLEDLDLSRTAIEEVPSSISELISLAYWSLEGCTKLKSLPESICKLKSLSELHLSKTAIEEVPSSISELESLSHWSMEDCTNLKSLPNSIGKLKSLETLNLDGCSNLEHFPEILQTMGCLFYLRLRRTGINVLHPWNRFGVGNLVFLKKLHLSGSDIEEIPEGIKQLSNLIHLYLTCCKSLKSLPELPPCLRYLFAQGCISLESFSKFWSKKIGPRFLKRNFESGVCVYETYDENYFMFNNCFNLDRDAVNNIVASTLLKIQRMAEEFAVGPNNPLEGRDKSVVSCFPGSEIPETFKNSSSNSSITVKLSPACSNKRFLGFVLCVVVDFKHHQEGIFYVDCEFRLKTECGDHRKVAYRKFTCSKSPFEEDKEERKGIESNHVIVSFLAFKGGIVETSRDEHFDEASFDFSVRLFDSEIKFKEQIEVQKCGVKVFYVDTVRSNDKEVESSTIYWSDGEKAVDPTNETLEPSCDANSSFIQDEENRCGASMSEPNSALGPNRLSLKCDANSRDLEGSVMEEDANDEEGLGDDPTTTMRARLKRRFGSDEEEEPDPQRPRYSH